MDINQYLLNNPNATEMLFTKIFGRYLMRYYDTSGYAVRFSLDEETSYNDEKNKIIVIAFNNIMSMLNKNVNVLAVAYHELAHTLYTSNKTRDDIRNKAVSLSYDACSQMGKYISHDKLDNIHHALWNILEDHIIETKLAQDFDFLKPIIEPLRQIVQDDNLLLSWRKGAQVDPLIHTLADEYVSPKRKSNKRRAEILSEIFVKFYLPKKDENAQNNPIDKLTDSDNANIKEDMQQKRNLEATIEHLDNSIKSQETKKQALEQSQDESQDERYKRALDESIKYVQDQIDDAEQVKERIQQEYEQKYGQRYGEQITMEKALEQLDEIKSIQVENDVEKTIKDILLSNQKTLVDNIELVNFNESVEHIDPSKLKDIQYITKLKKPLFNPKQKIRQGMSMALTKKYSENISSKISVQRIVSSKTNHTPPSVFQNRGKDVQFLKKVVVFEDVSGSVPEHLGKAFGEIALSLSSAFDSVEWYGYSSKLWKKPKNVYEYMTREIGQKANVSSGRGTSTYRLLTVMKKYKKENNTYVIITDGDMKSIFQDSETWGYFKNKTCVLGILDDEIKKEVPYHVDIDTRKLYSTDKKYNAVIYDSVKQVLAMIQNNIR